MGYFVVTSVGIFKKKINDGVVSKKKNFFAIIIAARNEEDVIDKLITSLKKQNYSNKYFDIYVIVNNCTDNTFEVAKRAGAKVIYDPPPQKPLRSASP